MKLRTAILLAVLWPSLLPSMAAAQVKIREVAVHGTGDADIETVRDAFRRVLDEPRSDDLLVEAIDEAESLPGVGSIAVDVEGPEVTVRFDDQIRRVAEARFAYDAEPPLDLAATWQLRQQIRARARLYLPAGARYHPFLSELERRAIRDDLRDQGFRDGVVRVEETHNSDLVYLTYRLIRGARYRVDEVAVNGVGASADVIEGLRKGLATQPDAYASPSDLKRDARAMQRSACRAGYPRARVSVVEKARRDNPEAPKVDVRFTVSLGPYAESGRVQVVGFAVPWAFMRTLPLQEGSPFCETRLNESIKLLRGYLQERGLYDPRLVVHRRARIVDVDHRKLSVTLEVVSRRKARISQIWFTGNKVTREDIIRQRMAIKEGDVYRQSAIDESVQALRRTGLFRKVRLRVVDSTAPGFVYLYFDLDEQTPIRIDVASRRVVLRNMDVTNWPSDIKHLEKGGFRGGGQQVSVTGAVEQQGFRWRNDFLSRNWLTELGMDRRTSSKTGFEASWYTLRGGIGTQGLEGRISALPFAELEWTNNKQESDAELPILDGDALTLAGGIDLFANLNRLDDERIPFFGLDIRYVPRVGRSVAGESFSWFDHDSTLRIHLPLYTNKREQHVVLRLRGRFRQVVAQKSGKLQAHRRTTPGLRGYGSSTVSLDFPVGDDTVSLGGLTSLESTIELRIPLPLRRNAIIPFVDVASTGDSPDQLRDRFVSPGLAMSFSLFGERLEGVLWAAYGLNDASRTYAGGTFGGSF